MVTAHTEPMIIGGTTEIAETTAGGKNTGLRAEGHARSHRHERSVLMWEAAARQLTDEQCPTSGPVIFELSVETICVARMRADVTRQRCMPAQIWV